MQFIDEATILVKSGKGGNGCISFLREKHRPKGGPDGGDGGRGGSVILKGKAGLNTLVEFQYKSQFFARRGQHGKGKTKHGKDAPHLAISVPLGTVVEELNTGQILGEMLADGQSLIVARRGRGGQGNARFATATEQAPRWAEPGEEGEERWLKLTLKLLAQVGIIGFPNAGKSSLLARVSAARPRVAPYPFTTLVPMLGVVRVGEGESFVMADIPGLIEGAHRGAGLGVQFLRHIERTRFLVHLLDLDGVTGRDPRSDYHQLNQELGLYSQELATRPQVVAANKIDLPEAREKAARLRESFSSLGLPFFAISALTGEGVKELMDGVWLLLKARPTG